MEGQYTEAWERGDHVRHPRFPGVALWFIGYSPRMTNVDEEDYEWELDYDTARVRMVGDDLDRFVSSAELTALDEEEFCGECGQIGCGHG